MSRWTDDKPAEMLGDLGSGNAQRWNPRDLNYYERQWRSQRGAWGDPGDVADHLEQDVAAVVKAFQERGSVAGLETARRKGLGVAARVYLEARAETEEELAVRLAAIRSRLARSPTMLDRLREAFVRARLDEVRAAGAHTPPQAVADKPEVPRRAVSRWVPYTALAISVVVLVRSFSR